jgi:hypothetical protein
MDLVHNYVFWYNTYDNLWYAIPRDQYTSFFSGHLPYEGVLKSSKIDTLILIIEHPEQLNK